MEMTRTPDSRTSPDPHCKTPRMFEAREVLRLWLRGEGIRAVARLSRVDRKTVRRYVDAAIEVGATGDGGVGQLTDVTLGRVFSWPSTETVQVGRPVIPSPPRCHQWGNRAGFSGYRTVAT